MSENTKNVKVVFQLHSGAAVSTVVTRAEADSILGFFRDRAISAKAGTLTVEGTPNMYINILSVEMISTETVPHG